MHLTSVLVPYNTWSIRSVVKRTIFSPFLNFTLYSWQKAQIKQMFTQSQSLFSQSQFFFCLTKKCNLFKTEKNSLSHVVRKSRKYSKIRKRWNDIYFLGYLLSIYFNKTINKGLCWNFHNNVKTRWGDDKSFQWSNCRLPSVAQNCPVHRRAVRGSQSQTLPWNTPTLRVGAN